MSKVETEKGAPIKPSNKAPSEKKKALPNKQKLPKEVDKDSLRYLYNEREKLKKAQKLARKEHIAEIEINKSKQKLDDFRSEVSEKIINSLNRENGSKGLEIKEYDFMSYISALTLKGNRVKWDEKEARKVRGGSIAYIEEKNGKKVVIIEYKGKKRVVGTVLEGFEKKKDKKEETPKKDETKSNPETSTIPKAPTPRLDIPDGELPKSDAKSDTKGDEVEEATPESTPAPQDSNPSPEPTPVPAPAGDSNAGIQGAIPASATVNPKSGITDEEKARISDFTKNLGGNNN